MAGYEKALNKNNFNFLRLAGACLVIFSHCYDIIGKSGSEPIENFLQSKLAASGIGLCIFFFISGYFVSKSAVETKGVFYFLKKRIYRIYPALIIIVLLTVFVLGPIFSTLKISAYFLQPDTWKYLYTISGIRIRAILPGVFTGEHFFSNGVNASIWTISWEIILYIFLALLI
jgi:peptidoglycan/LPS O-acetylase OafA/YrhL